MFEQLLEVPFWVLLGFVETVGLLAVKSVDPTFEFVGVAVVEVVEMGAGWVVG